MIIPNIIWSLISILGFPRLPAIILFLIPIFYLFRRRNNRIAVILGSGGHTGEMMRMIQNSGHPLDKFTFWVQKNDPSSELKIHFGREERPIPIIRITRARNIGQSLLSACIFNVPFSLMETLFNLIANWPKKVPDNLTTRLYAMDPEFQL
jgi:hypothetical protein